MSKMKYHFDVPLPAATLHRVRIEALLDEALAASFPSSDPITLDAPAGSNPDGDACSHGERRSSN
jgi:hypothetical protein